MSDPIDTIQRIKVRQTASEAVYVVQLSRELREHLERGDHARAGGTAGEMLKWALRLIEDGARVTDVRALIDLGAQAARAAQTSERAA